MGRASDKTSAARSGSRAEYWGHRSRLRERFRKSRFSGMLTYEVLEYLLTIALPRRDVKPLARELLRRYGTITNVLSQPPEELAKVPGLGDTSSLTLTAFMECMRFCLEEELPGRDLLQSPDDIVKFARMKIGTLHHECYMVIFLTSRNHLISWRIISEGEVDLVFSSPRNIVEIALNNFAGKVVLVHNHPSGVCVPSGQDVEATKELQAIFARLNVALADHLVVSAWEYFSFSMHGLLPDIWSKEKEQ